MKKVPVLVPVLVGVVGGFAAGGGLLLGTIVSDQMDLAYDPIAIPVWAAFAVVGTLTVVGPYHLMKRRQRRRSNAK